MHTARLFNDQRHESKCNFYLPTIRLQIIRQIHVESLLANTNSLRYEVCIVTGAKALGPGCCGIDYIM